jgi:hypothetical protein
MSKHIFFEEEKEKFSVNKKRSREKGDDVDSSKKSHHKTSHHRDRDKYSKTTSHANSAKKGKCCDVLS